MSFDRVPLKTKQESVATESTPSTPEANFRMRVVNQEPAPTSPVKDVPMSATGISKKVIIGGLLGVIVLGGITGGAGAYLMNTAAPAPIVADQTANQEQIENAVKVGAVFGVADEKTFRDSAEGVLIIGGIDGEGSHTLLRENNASQNVYLTSSVVDLDQFANMRVKVAGETFEGQKAGWLMDVGRVEIVELEAQKPSWYKEK